MPDNALYQGEWEHKAKQPATLLADTQKPVASFQPYKNAKCPPYFPNYPCQEPWSKLKCQSRDLVPGEAVVCSPIIYCKFYFNVCHTHKIVSSEGARGMLFLITTASPDKE